MPSRSPVRSSIAFALAATLACLAHAAPARAQGSLIVVKGYAVSGQNPLGAGHTGRVLAPYLGVPATAEVLRAAQLALEVALQERGYTHYRVVLPVQTPGETIMLDVVPAALTRIQVQGPRLGRDDVRRALPELQEGRSPNTQRLARQLAAANDHGARRLAVRLIPGPGADELHAQVQVQDRPAWGAAAAWANDGTRATGRDRLALQLHHHDVAGTGHQLRLGHVTSLDQPGRVQEWRVGYRVPLPRWGAAFYLAHARTETARLSDPWREEWGLAPDAAPGRHSRAGYVQYLATASRLVLEVADHRYAALEEDGRPRPGPQRRSQPLTLAYHTGQGRAAGTTDTAGYVEMSANLARGEAGDLGAYRGERPEIDTTRWKRLRAGVQLTGDLAGGWAWTLRGQAQYSPDPLLAGDAFALGGAGSVRGAPERARVGDSGLVATLEALTPVVLGGWRGLAFVDAGALRNHQPSAARPEKDRLASVGIGVRYLHPSGARLVADYGRLVAGSRADLAEAPDKGDDKLHVSLSYTF